MSVRPARPGPSGLLRLLLHGLAVLVIAGIVHLAAMLAWPSVSRQGAFARVAALSGATSPLHTVPLPPAAARTFAYPDPAVASAVCLFDLRAAPVRVSVDVAGAPFLALSVHTRLGQVAYGLTDRSASRGHLAVTLMTAAQKSAAEADETDGDVDQELRVAVDEERGFVEVDVLAPTPLARAEAEGMSRRLVCGTPGP